VIIIQDIYREIYEYICCDYDTRDEGSIQLFQLRLSPEQSGKVEYERESERLLGTALKIH
jgi:hypothetical protein